MKRISLLFVLLLSFNGWSTTIDDFKAHEPTNTGTWAEQWFYNVADPAIGYFKISFQTYIAPTHDNNEIKSYIHLAFTPINGATIKYDLFNDDPIVAHPTDPNKFYYELPGLLKADEETLSITHPDFSFNMEWTGPHKQYWKGLNPYQTPFSFIPELPGVGGKWFLYTVGTPIQYDFNNGAQAWSGSGYAQVDKGWYDKETSVGMMYMMGLSDDVKFMFTGAVFGDTTIEMWGGRYISDNYDLVFLPAFKGLSVKRESDPCNGTLSVEMKKIGKKITINAAADIDTFYSQSFPSAIIFGGEQRYMKSMKANVDFNVYEFGRLKEEVNIAQALLEFSGRFACDAVVNPQ
ncbi:MAG: hypothetical protein JXR16_15785 [Bermanella sp.]